MKDSIKKQLISERRQLDQLKEEEQAILGMLGDGYPYEAKTRALQRALNRTRLEKFALQKTLENPAVTERLLNLLP